MRSLSSAAISDPDATVMPMGVAAESAACWRVDLSQVRTLIDTVADGGAWIDWVAALLHGARIIEVNARALELVGSPIARDIIVGQPVASFCPPESWPILAELIVAVASDRPDHAVRTSRVNSFLLRDAVLMVWGAAGGAAPDTLWIAVDGEIADDRSFWAVRASEQRYRRLIHHLPGALLQVDARPMGAIFYRLRSEGVTDIASYLDEHPELVATACEVVRVTDGNGGAALLFGVAGVGDLVGSVAYLFANAPEAARRIVVAHFEGRRSHVERMKLRTFDGRLIDVELSVTFPTPPESLDVTLLTLEDITERLRTEAQLRQLQADYSRTARIATLGEMASSIAHEVNQPLSAIAMNAETCLRWLSRDDPNLAKVSQLTTRIADSARHASEIVQRIRGMVARHVPESVPIDLNGVVEEALLFVCHDIEARAIVLSVRFDITLPRVLGDRVQLQQVIVNLLVNSLQALAQKSAGEGRIALTTATGADDTIRFSIRDNGAGIAEENLDRIFDGFFTTKADGMGIGLAVCQSIIAAHGGSISASNHHEGGARFEFTLPALEA
ncbi:ATP-binding protein [Sphingomonas cannabina]|uniref:PAS domain-containing sensor histidine kinase n=1 Tax=Sphingomonas cannabina TaxID=2899123 RepID=UPI001F1ABC0C|nr:ATP-binding protein [Sphingomonas cannabina]UIJ45533.1 ATP-binding protein [Sphingomonas cannabina]